VTNVTLSRKVTNVNITFRIKPTFVNVTIGAKPHIQPATNVNLTFTQIACMQMSKLKQGHISRALAYVALIKSTYVYVTSKTNPTYSDW
jgi:hypothetical protein